MQNSKIIRYFYIFIGSLSLIIGLVGVIFPILPTVPFLLLTSFCYAKGSQKFNDWFIKSKIYNKYLKDFVASREMSISRELILLSVVSVMLFATMWVVNKISVSIILLFLIIIKYLYFIFFIKTQPKITREKNI